MLQLRAAVSPLGAPLTTRLRQKAFLQTLSACAAAEPATALMLLGSHAAPACNGGLRVAEICTSEGGPGPAGPGAPLFSTWSELLPALALLQLLAEPSLVAIGRLYSEYHTPVLSAVRRHLNFESLAAKMAALLARGAGAGPAAGSGGPGRAAGAPATATAAAAAPLAAAAAPAPFHDDILDVHYASAAAFATASASAVVKIILKIKQMFGADAPAGIDNKNINAAVLRLLELFGPGAPAGLALTRDAQASLALVARLVQLESDIAAGAAAGAAARERRAADRAAAARAAGGGRNAALAAEDFPGELRPAGPRHDNDRARIQDIAVAPTEEEVLCPLPPYLPANEPGGSPHLPLGTPEALLDSHFRLMRQDLLGSLVDSMQAFTQGGGLAGMQRGQAAFAARRAAGADGAAPRGNRDELELSVYRDARVGRGVPHKKAGLAYEVLVNDVAPGRAPGMAARRAFWEETQRLQTGTLVALYQERGAPQEQAEQGPRVIFLTVAGIEGNGPPKGAQPVVGEGGAARVRLHLGVCSAADHPHLLAIMERCATLPRPGAGAAHGRVDRAAGPEGPGEYVLLQASGSFFSYAPVLRALQQSQLPAWFNQYCTREPSAAEAGLPEYIAAGTRYDLSCIAAAAPDEAAAGAADVDGAAASVAQRLRAARAAVARVDLAAPLPLAAISLATGLDEMQTRALAAALTRNMVLIQGPPGTGKTFVGAIVVSALLANTCIMAPRPAAGAAAAHGQPVIGPIIVLCLTNHALDQFLEALYKRGLRKIVRVGGRSKSTLLASLNLREIARAGTRERAPRGGTGHLVGEKHRLIDALQQEANGILEGLCVPPREVTWRHLAPVALAMSPGLHASIEASFGNDWIIDADGYMQKQPRDAFAVWRDGRDFVRPPPPARAAAPLSAADVNRFGALRLDGDADYDGLGFQPVPRPAAAVGPADAAASDIGSARGDHVHDQDALAGVAPPWYQRRGLADADALAGAPLADLLAGDDAWALGCAARRAVLESWAGFWRESLRAEAARVAARLHAEQAALQGLQQARDLEILRQAQVVGLTTSGGSTSQALLRSLGARVVLVEEAAEVLESHVLACLSESTQQLILIGDHQQLRPSVETYHLSIDSGAGYNLDVSMFERLILTQRVPAVTLRTQWRMRPEIAALVKGAVYPDLADAAAVRNLPHVPGLARDLFFVSHSSPEAGGGLAESKSKSNDHEARMAVGLARHLLLQGVYGPEDITILVPYTGQLARVRTLLAREAIAVATNERDAEQLDLEAEAAAAAAAAAGSADGDGDSEAPDVPAAHRVSTWAGAAAVARESMQQRVRAATVDNFQGEESKVVIISLTRSNPQNIVGFLKLVNRVNVLLSRAQHGMYLLGNAECFRASTRAGGLWDRLLGMLEAQGAVGPALELRCANHPHTSTHIFEPEQFEALVGDGGCARRCETRLGACGHQCPKRCHVDDPAHKQTHCPQPCNRLHAPCGHVCRRLCGDACGACQEPIASVALACGHIQTRVPCHLARSPEKIVCHMPVSVKISQPDCGHTVSVACHAAAAVLAGAHNCPASCPALLTCGHPCRGTCGACGRAGRHGQCSVVCGRPQICGHTCRASCHGEVPCPPCTLPCPTKCTHTACKDRCIAPCAACAEPCPWACEHQGACALTCGAPCDRLPCDLRCSKTLPCGHRCPSVCGEACPPLCVACSPAALRAQQVDMILLSEMADVDPDNDPLIYLSCGHVFTMDTLDGWLGLESAYARRADCGSAARAHAAGAAAAAAAAAAAPWATLRPFGPALLDRKACPMCKRGIAGVRRYGRLLNKMALDTSERKFLLGCGALAQRLAGAIQGAEAAVERLRASAQPSPAEVHAAIGAVRSGEAWLADLCAAIRAAPAQRVYEASVAALTRSAEAAAAESAGGDAAAPQAGPVTRARGAAVAAAAAATRPLPGGSAAALGARYGFDLAAVVREAREAGASLAADARVRAVLLPAQPDARAPLQAEVGAGRLLLLRASVAAIHQAAALADLREASADALLDARPAVRGALAQYERLFDAGWARLQAAVAMAEAARARRLHVTALLHVARAGVQRAQEGAARTGRLFAAAAGYSPEEIEATKAALGRMLDGAEAAVTAAVGLQRELTSGSDGRGGHGAADREAAAADAEFETIAGAVRAGAAAVRRALAAPEHVPLSPEEARAVFSAMAEGSRGQGIFDMAGGGYTGQGHWYTCPNGHVYVIGECGGAVQEARCPECGAGIGGAAHRLRADNAVASDFLRQARGGPA